MALRTASSRRVPRCRRRRRGARKQVRRDGDVTGFGQLIRDASGPIGEAEDFVDDNDRGRLVLHFGIGDGTIHFTISVFDLYPLEVARGFFDAGLGPILGRAVDSQKGGGGEQAKSIHNVFIWLAVELVLKRKGYQSRGLEVDGFARVVGRRVQGQQQRMLTGGGNVIAMAHTFRDEDEITGAGGLGIGADGQDEFAFEDVKAMIGVRVEMERGVAGDFEVFHAGFGRGVETPEMSSVVSDYIGAVENRR